LGRRSPKRKRGTRAFVGAALCALSASLLAFGLPAKPAGLLAKLDVNHVTIDLAGGHYRVSPALAATPDGAESFESMVQRVKPIAAICGAYYDHNYRPLGDIVIAGKVVCRGCQRQGIGFTAGNKIRFLERRSRSRINWRGCVSGIACGPRLVRAGRLDIDVTRDGFSAAAATKTARRCAVGSTKDGKLILCVVDEQVTLRTLGLVMIELGARDAINLDGGGSCALYSDGKFLVRPTWPMSNILAVCRQ
jgi:exopolysaccharide biosynthesis protein